MSKIATGQRTYFLGLSSVTQLSETFNIAFKDTAGNNIKCNYFNIDIANSRMNAGDCLTLVAELSGISTSGTITSNNITQINKFYTVLNGSGICGVGTVVGGAGKSSVEWHGTNGDVCTGLKIKVEGNFNTAGATTIYGITYGNLIPYNILRGAQYDKGI